MPKLRIFLLFLAFAVVAVLSVVAVFQLMPDERSRQTASNPASLNPKISPSATQTKNTLTPAQTLAATRHVIDEQLAAAPEFAPFFAKLKTAFPAAHARIIDGFADAVRKGKRIETADLYLAQALRGLRSSHGILAANASPEVLEQLFALKAKTMSALATQDPKLCADFLYGATTRNFFKFSAANRKLVAAMMEAGLTAITDGKKTGTERTAPDASDLEKLEAELKQRQLEKPEIDMLLDARMPDPPLADTTICKAGLAYYEALRALPEDLRMKIYAQLLKLSARS